MKNMKLKVITVAVAAALGLAACGSNTSNPALTGGKTTSGVITGFGSVFVNGVEYDTGGASVSMDGASSAESNLKVGMVVSLVGSVDANGTTGIASTISFADETQGFVTTAYDATAKTIGVMGQTVHITTDTIFDSDDSGKTVPTSAASLLVGDTVEVSGFSSGTGDIYATRIAYKPGTEDIELKGVVSGAVANTSFMLGGLTISYDTNTSMNVGSGIVDGMYVEVKFPKGTVSAANFVPGGSLIASSIETEGDGKKGEQGSEGEEAELQGKITAVDLANNMFMLNGQMITISAETKYEDGTFQTSQDLVAGSKVEVEGSYNTTGNLLAEKVHFGSNEADIMETSGTFVSYDATTKIVTFTEATPPATVTVTVDNMTIVKDDSTTADRYFNASKLVAGDMIEVKYDNGSKLATRLERK